MAGNFGFRGRIGLNGLDFFVSFWSNAKKKINKEIKIGLLTFSAALNRANLSEKIPFFRDDPGLFYARESFSAF